ncbi:(2Fe-2S)-binding protein [Xenophilus azovorans]|uniref:(2Fe-2S)-binding protein n=1 Tax=Xenophilus azovorans TaxID=151755 RepID=UPI0005710D0C|nr:(2Fe-2S)-binding protein [Xenophilus azovorans]
MAETTARRTIPISMLVNGCRHHLAVDPRHTLADLLRDQLGLTGLHLGCEQGVCGACTVHIDGEPVVSCLTLAVEAQDVAIRTVEDLAQDGALSALQQAFLAHGAFQCGYCTPGFLMVGQHLLDQGLATDRDAVREGLSGNICRCTGYEPIIDAILSVAQQEPRA